MNFATLDLNLLRVLDAILRDGSTTRAGERLGVSQSAVSNALNRLRHALDDDLFIRQGNRLVPTDFTASITGDLRDHLERLESLLTRSRFDPAQIRATYRISGGDYFSEMLMPALSARMATAAPHLLLQQVSWEPTAHLHMLEDGSADIGLGPLLAPLDDIPPWIVTRLLFHSSFVGIAAADNPLLSDLAEDAPLPLDRYFDTSHVLFSVSGAIESFEDDIIARLGRNRRIGLTVPSFRGIFRAVEAGPHIAAVPTSLARAIAAQYAIRTFALPFDPGRIPIYATWHKRSDKTPAARWIRDHIVALIEPLDRDLA